MQYIDRSLQNPHKKEFLSIIKIKEVIFMVKVKKYSKEKKKQDTANARAEVKKQKYSLMQNLSFAMREIWRADKLVVISCFGFAAAMFAMRLADTYFQKYVVELAITGFERRLIFMCVGLFLLKTLSNFIAPSS